MTEVVKLLGDMIERVGVVGESAILFACIPESLSEYGEIIRKDSLKAKQSQHVLQFLLKRIQAEVLPAEHVAQQLLSHWIKIRRACKIAQPKVAHVKSFGLEGLGLQIAILGEVCEMQTLLLKGDGINMHVPYPSSRQSRLLHYSMPSGEECISFYWGGGMRGTSESHIVPYPEEGNGWTPSLDGDVCAESFFSAPLDAQYFVTTLSKNAEGKIAAYGVIPPVLFHDLEKHRVSQGLLKQILRADLDHQNVNALFEYCSASAVVR